MKTYDINIKDENGEKVSLKFRLTLEGQIKFRDVCGTSTAAEGIGMAIADPAIMAKFLDITLNYKNNENKINDGEELYDLLIDNGYSGQADFVPLITSIAMVSGMLNAARKKYIDDAAKAAEEEFEKEHAEETPEEDPKN